MKEQAQDREQTAGGRAFRLVWPAPGVRLWVCRRFQSRRLRLSLLIAAGVFLLALTVVVAALPFVGLSQSRMEQLGYPGLFITNFFSTALFFLPLPGLSAAGQALIVTMADQLDPVPVALVGGAAMGLGELAPYGAGRGLRRLSTGRDLPVRGRLALWLQRAGRWVDWMMANYGVIALFLLSALPNPLFEFAGLTAGATRMRAAKFLVPVLGGKLVRAFLLAYLGQEVLHLFA